ncbi:MAG: hypothetical protein V8S98_00430 [Lachnospiraceae bacterium]
MTNWGLYAELPNTVEGWIQVNDLTGDYSLVFDEKHMKLVGEMTRKGYKYTKIRVQVAHSYKSTRMIDFTPLLMTGRG